MFQRRVYIRPLRDDLRAIGLIRESEDDPKPSDLEEPEEELPAEEDDEDPDLSVDVDGEEEADDDQDLSKTMEALSVLAGGFLRRNRVEHAPRRPAARRPAPTPRVEHRSGNRTISSLLEDLSGVMNGIRRTKLREQIKGFANIALIADTLSERFKRIGLKLSEKNLYRVSHVMRKLAEDAQANALALDDPGKEREEDDDDSEDPDRIVTTEQDGDDEKVNALFKMFMSKLMDALQLYNDVTGKSEGDEDPELDISADDDEEPAYDDDEEPADDDEEPVAEGDDGDEEPEELEDEDPIPDEENPAEKAVAEARKMLAKLRSRYMGEARTGKGAKKAKKRTTEAKKRAAAKKRVESKKAALKAKAGRRH